ncbi:MAG TPA: hypothetical protein VKM72_23605 [Thermoanaerobaculia bacterium]|nr:hypothetical protein [Thermoanaerobaculia bacterium]
MPDDYIYTVNQVALILNKSDKTVRTYIAEGGLDSTKKIEEASGMEKVYISALSLASLAEKKSFRLNFDELRKYTPNREVLEHTFGHRHLSEPREDNTSATPENPAPRSTASNTAEESLVVSILKDQVSRLEAEKNELKQDLKEKDRQLEEKNVALIATTRETSDRYQLLAVAKEQAEAQLAQLREQTRILHLSTNRDLTRLKDGKLQAGDLSFLPTVETPEEGFWTEPPEEKWSSPFPAEEEIRIPSEPVSPVTPLADEPEQSAHPEEGSAPPAPLPREEAKQTELPKAKREKGKGKKREKDKATPRKGFFRRLFGG